MPWQPRPSGVVRYDPMGASAASIRSSRSAGSERGKPRRNPLTGLRRATDGDQRTRFSTTMAIPWPTPMHMVASPYRDLRRESSWTRVAVMRTPLAPRGWPSAMAPPLGFTRAGSSSRSRTQAMTWEANASFNSMRSMSLVRSPARASALRDAGMGPRPMQDGSTPALAAARILALGRALRRWARDSDLMPRHAAPYL